MSEPKLLYMNSLEEKKAIAKLFAQELKAFAEYWEAECEVDETVSIYLASDLERFPAMIKEEMMRRGYRP